MRDALLICGISVVCIFLGFAGASWLSLAFSRGVVATSRQRDVGVSSRHLRDSALAEALTEAVALYPFMPGGSAGSALLSGVIQLTPTEYGATAASVALAYAEGSAVSVDLRGMNEVQAIRLIDFCSGMVAANSGWLFRAASQVVIVVPSM